MQFSSAIAKLTFPGAQRQAALIVDADDLFRGVLRKALAGEFCFRDVVEAQTMDAAMEMLGEGGAFKIAVFDLFTLGARSAEKLRGLRASFPDMPIAVVSTSSDRRDILLALEAGVNGFIAKASGMRATGAGLRAVLGGSIYVPSSIALVGAKDGRAIFFSEDDNYEQDNMNSECLTPRQSEVLNLVVEGKSNKEIARRLNLAEGTVKVHMAALFRGLGVSSRSAAAALGARIGARIGARTGASIGARTEQQTARK